ncbi:MAG: DUF368 domain-containing protein [Clostridia bacterium]|jgi:putative membrane protein|nr:DUF368 domain-containing protein [Clostridia bacterium]
MIKRITVLLKGFAIGIANIIPGVSGGTLALILGIYERLVTALSNFSFHSAKTIIFLFSFKRRHYEAFRAEMKRVDGLFLASVLVGIALAFVAFSSLMTYMIETYHDITYGFFFGLILASIKVPFSKIKKRNVKTIIAILIGIAIVVLLASIQSDADKIASEQLRQAAKSGTETMLGNLTAGGIGMIFLAGVLATSAMILPGISGSFISLLLGQYFILLNAVSTGNFYILGAYIIGAIIGIKLFAKMMKFLFKRFHDVIMAFLTGLVIGSLYVTWPFKGSALVGDETVYLSNAFPNTFGTNEILTIVTTLVGIVVVILMLIMTNRAHKGKTAKEPITAPLSSDSTSQNEDK